MQRLLEEKQRYTDMDMHQYISQRLGGMKSVMEKDMLRDVMEDIFIPMYNHMEKEYA